MSFVRVRVAVPDSFLFTVTRLYELRFICTIEFIDHIQLSTRIMHKKLREAKLKLVIKTDIKDISSVGQSPKRVTPHKAQNLNVWVMDETGMKAQIAWTGQMHHLNRTYLMLKSRFYFD